MYKLLLIAIIFFVWVGQCAAFADRFGRPIPGPRNLPQPAPVATTNNTASSSNSANTTPHISLAPSDSDKDVIDKFFRNATYGDFEKQKEFKVFDIQ